MDYVQAILPLRRRFHLGRLAMCIRLVEPSLQVLASRDRLVLRWPFLRDTAGKARNERVRVNAHEERDAVARNAAPVDGAMNGGDELVICERRIVGLSRPNQRAMRSMHNRGYSLVHR